ncbi:hypothetical protein H4F99_10925 [Lysobacter sp. SG-8]|uniref:Uncharacterized protein n=1 Tax=Marilutibacter penaei TaxID=2759900 RepID=A0A7W3U500_9GAMM|nr:hypothetical protein [Lysobacter penaei]MBB1089002.1 hypothetical protein [Lysobacter penaei]
MNRFPNDPLTPEERALAARLGAMGPHEGPPPELDARIRSAARAATRARPHARRRRWLGLSGGAGGLVTGLGMAASLTLVLGVVWQLRPMESTVPVPRESTDGAAVMVEHLPRAPSRLRQPPPPPAEPTALPPAALPSGAPATDETVTAIADDVAAATAEAEGAAKAAREAERQAADARSAMRDADIARQQAVERAHAGQRAQREAGAAEDMAGVAEAAAAEDSPAPESAPAPARRATYTRSARATADAAVRPLKNVGSAPQAAAASAPLAATDAASLPDVGLDRDLDVDDWLQRIRDRRDAGQTEAARESLDAFVHAHPGVTLPDDLQALVDPGAR